MSVPLDMSVQARPRTLIMRAGLAVVALIAFVVAVGFVFDISSAERIRETILGLRETPYAWAYAIGILVVLNVAGVPLMVLTAAAAAVFGPWLGFAYSWLASMLGAAAGYFAGDFFGAEILKRFGGERVNRISASFAKRGILSCAAVRLVPTAPAVIVNVLIGTSHIGFVKFAIGTGLGIAPKLILISFVTSGMIEVGETSNVTLMAMLSVLILGWIVAMFFARRLIRRWWDRDAGNRGEPDSGGSVKDTGT